MELSIFGFSVVNMKDATLSWQLAKPMDCKYTVEMKAPGEDWVVVAKNIKTTTYKVVNLVPEDQYEFRLSAITTGGVVTERTRPLILEPRKGS